MKFGKVGQVVLVTAIAFGVASLFTACGTLTVGFMYVPTTKQTPGQMEVYEVNSESGVLRTIPTSPFPSGGRNPIAEVADSASQNLYVANNEDNNIVQFGIGTDGKLYPQSTINTPGTYPIAVTLNSAGTFAYVVDTLGPVAGCSLANPCPGLIAGYAITPSSSSSNSGSNVAGSLGQVCSSGTTSTCTLGNPIINSNNLGYVSLQLSALDQTVLTPSSVNVTANGSFAYVTAFSATTGPNTILSPIQGYLFAFSIGSSGSLTPIPIGPQYQFNGQQAQMVPLPLGTEPVSMTSDSQSQYLYVVDSVKDQVESFSLAASGVPSQVGAFAAGNQPSSLAIFKDQYLYVANALDSTVDGYSISSGSLTKIGTYASSTNPVAIAIDPRNVGFVYTVNFLGSSLSGYKIDQSTGALINTQASPYASTAQPTAISGIPHGGSATAK